MTDKPQDATPVPTPPVDDDLPVHRPGLMARIRNYFLTGLIVAGPLAITALSDLVRSSTGSTTWCGRSFRWPTGRKPICRSTSRATGLIVAFVALTLLGFLTANLVGRTLVEFGETAARAACRSCGRSTSGLKQVFETLFSETGSSFRKVGLVEFPVAGHVVAGVHVAVAGRGDLRHVCRDDEEYVSVFLPCTPNPTTGFFFYVPRSDMIELDMTVEAAATLIMSAGMVQPRRRRHAEEDSALAAPRWPRRWRPASHRVTTRSSPEQADKSRAVSPAPISSLIASSRSNR